MAIKELQLGKNGITPTFIQTLKTYFTDVRTVKVSVLPSARESKDDVKKYANELLEKMGVYYTARCIGFTITLKKWRKARE
ncbi:MAG: YhbY family RNA-binding protein [Nanoarchaeota archaeon]|jgi:RNA-binding protein YhbY|nr:YhbY family RNA-binding protein [Nanoarchaeota archaeon]